MSFAIANVGEFSRQMDDWKMDQTQDVLVAAKNQMGEVFLMKDDLFRYFSSFSSFIFIFYP